MSALTQARLKELLSYDPETGLFTWKVGRRGPARAGAVAGCCHQATQGYVNIQVAGSIYRAHRLAWFYIHGEWPAAQLDHINHARADNRIANIRCVTNRENSHNRGSVVGFSFRAGRKKPWQAQLMVDGRGVSIGCYDTQLDARAAYLRAKRLHHPSASVHCENTL